MSEDALWKTALENAKNYIDSRNLPDAHITDRILVQIDEALNSESVDTEQIKEQAFQVGYKQRETEYGLKAKHVQELISDAYKEGKIDRDNETATQLLELPGEIKTRSLMVGDLTANIEQLRLSIANIKSQALELVLSATYAGKPKYSNDKARNLAVEQLLREDKLYLDNIDEISRKECELRKEQIQLDFLHNQFRSYLAVAQMQGVK